MHIACWNADAALTSRASIDADVNKDGKLMHARLLLMIMMVMCVLRRNLQMALLLE